MSVILLKTEKEIILLAKEFAKCWPKKETIDHFFKW